MSRKKKQAPPPETYEPMPPPLIPSTATEAELQHLQRHAENCVEPDCGIKTFFEPAEVLALPTAMPMEQPEEQQVWRRIYLRSSVPLGTQHMSELAVPESRYEDIAGSHTIRVWVHPIGRDLQADKSRTVTLVIPWANIAAVVVS